MTALNWTVALFISFCLLIDTLSCNETCIEDPYIHSFGTDLWLYAHDQDNYSYFFPLLGLTYNLRKYEGINLEASVNVGIKNNQTFIYDYIFLGYTLRGKEWIYFCPFLKFENFDHYLKNSHKNHVTIVRNRFLFGVNVDKYFSDLWKIGVNPQLFKDLGMTVFFHREDNTFWGRTFHYSFGYKAEFVIEYFTKYMIDLIFSGFYLETFQRNYQEYGGAAAILWEF